MLNQLVYYARKNLVGSEPGFTTRTVRWLVELSEDGRFVNVLPLGDEKGGEQTTKCPEMHNMNAGGRAHFLVETLQTVALLFKLKEDSKKVAGSLEKHSYFKKMVCQASATVFALQPLTTFLESGEQLSVLRERLANEKAKPTDWLRWRIAGVDPLQQSAVLDWWRTWREADLGEGKAEGKPEAQQKGDRGF